MSAAQVTFSGASDDLIEVEGSVPGCDEYNADDAHFVCIGELAQVRLRVWFTRRGLWAIAAAPVAEDVPVLPVHINGGGYSAQATVSGVTTVIHEASAS